MRWTDKTIIVIIISNYAYYPCVAQVRDKCLELKKGKVLYAMRAMVDHGLVHDSLD